MPKDKITWKSEKRKIKDLTPFKGNPRKAGEKEIQDLDKSLNKFNLADPLVINTDEEVIGGNFRLSRLKEKGIIEADVRVPSRTLTRKESEELNLRLNKNSGLWDKDILANFSEELLKDVGWTGEELDDIFGLNIEEDDFDIDKEYEKIIEPKTKLGDMYQLGNHRLMCGDAAKKDDVNKLMGGEKADMVFTDPPYGINAIKKSGKIGGGGKLGFIGYKGVVNANIYTPIIGDDKPFDPTFLLEYGKNQIIFGGNYFADKLPITSGWIIWDKRETERRNNFADCEILWTSFKKPARIYRHLWMGLLRKGDRKTESKSFLHPTQKPVKLLSDILKDYSKRGQNIIDLFGGSGSTLIACEQLKRKCYIMELDPKYCDVIIKRFEKFTGKEAKKL